VPFDKLRDREDFSLPFFGMFRASGGFLFIFLRHVQGIGWISLYYPSACSGHRLDFSLLPFGMFRASVGFLFIILRHVQGIGWISLYYPSACSAFARHRVMRR